MRFLWNCDLWPWVTLKGQVKGHEFWKLSNMKTITDWDVMNVTNKSKIIFGCSLRTLSYNFVTSFLSYLILQFIFCAATQNQWPVSAGSAWCHHIRWGCIIWPPPKLAKGENKLYREDRKSKADQLIFTNEILWCNVKNDSLIFVWFLDLIRSKVRGSSLQLLNYNADIT